MASPLTIIESFSHELWTDKDISAIERYFDDTVEITSPLGSTLGVNEIKGIMEQWLNAFPDLKVDFDEYICQDDTVVSRWHAKGTHCGEFKGFVASGNTVEYTGVTIYKINNSKIQHYWALVDIHSLERQLTATLNKGQTNLF